MRTLLCIGAVLGLCGPACAAFDPFSGIVDGVAQEFAVELQEADPPQAWADGNVVIGSTVVTGSPATPEASLSLMPEPPENFIYDLVIPDICSSMPALADCHNFRPHIKEMPDEETAASVIQGVNLIRAGSD